MKTGGAGEKRPGPPPRPQRPTLRPAPPASSALAPLTVEPPGTQAFVNRFLARWGEAALENGERK